MKTQIFSLFFFALFISIHANAQFSFGIKGSYHSAWQEYGNDFGGNGNDLKIKGFSTSLMAYYAVGKHIEVGTEPGYIRRGAACEPGFFLNNPYLTGDATLYANYLTVPLFIKTKIPLFKGCASIFVKGGGGPSYLVDGYRQVNLQWMPDGTTQIQDINFEEEPSLRRWDWGLNGSAGLGVNLGPGALQVSYEMYRSLMDMNKELTSKNRNAGFALGYVIRL